ncbi:hypothetical protein F5X99DRAFT_334227 [Biscogniauxia marginata]|nr:hypothetical protein F5X99DRAFT_334227 [Biscogniauxia marginata]
MPMNDVPSDQSQNDRDNGFDKTRDLEDEYSDSESGSKSSDSHGIGPYFVSSNRPEVMGLRKSIPTKGGVVNYPSRQELLTFDENNTHALPNKAYHLNSFTGALVRRYDTLSSREKERDSHGGEDNRDQSETTLVDSLLTRHGDDERRISALRSDGIIINDPASLSAAPDIFKLEQTSPQPTSKDSKYGMPNVRNITHPKDDGESNFTDGTGPQYENSAFSRSETCEKRDTASIGNESMRSKSTDSGSNSLLAAKEHQIKTEDDPRSAPFLQWIYRDPTSGPIDSDDVVRRVLDQINERLRLSEGFKKYQRTPECSLEKLHEELTSSSNDDAGAVFADKILRYRKKKLIELKPKLFSSVRALVEMFIPINFEHDVTRKIWGGIHTIWRYMENIDVSKHRTGDLGYHIQGYEKDRELWQAMGMDVPNFPFEKCQGCSRGFNTFHEGVMHLKAVHFEAKYAQTPKSAESDLVFYLRTPQQIQTEARINILALLVQEICSVFNNLRERAKQLQLGARRPDPSDDGDGYPVMGKLVRAFESVTLLITTMTFEVSKVSRLMKKDGRNTQDSQGLLTRPRRSLNQANTEVQKHLEDAKIDMIIISRTDSLSDGVTLSSIGPEFMIAMMSSGMFLRKLKDATGNTIDTCELYKKYTTSLQFQVNQRPQRRSFADMYALEEELEILRRVIYWQQKFCNNLMRVLDPTSYKMTTKGRISHFRLESHYISRTLTRLEARDTELTALQNRTRSLREQLKQSIEILEESHGKAIRVFTFVTVFFLPLSFVTSFMGMNTTDIRDIDKDQKLFWIIALPITAVVMGLAFIYGYKWDTWKEEIVRRRKMQPQRPVVPVQGQATWPGLASQVPSRFRPRGGHTGDIESGVRRQETDFSYSSNPPKERRARFWGLRDDKTG